MKKLLIATAALAMVAGTAQAQSSVEIYGILSGGVSNVETSSSDANFTRKIKTTGNEGAQSGSRLGFRGTEDLGGGLKAGFVLELGADLDSGVGTGAADTTRLGYIQLESKDLGTVRAGRVDSFSRTVQNSYTSHGNSGFAPGNVAASYGYLGSTTTGVNGGDTYYTAMGWGQGSTVGGGRVSNTVGYISPAFGGVQLMAQFGKVESDVSTAANKAVAQDTTNVGISYNAGKLSAMIAQDKTSGKTEANPSIETEFQTNTVGLSYDFGVAKAFLAYTDRERTISNVNGKDKVKDTTVGVSVPLGKVVLVGSYSDGQADAAGVVENADVSAYQLQANYLFSKRTKAYVMYGETKSKGDTFTDKIDGYVVGVQHSF
jgi:predicted porin